MVHTHSTCMSKPLVILPRYSLFFSSLFFFFYFTYIFHCNNDNWVRKWLIHSIMCGKIQTTSNDKKKNQRNNKRNNVWRKIKWQKKICRKKRRNVSIFIFNELLFFDEKKNCRVQRYLKSFQHKTTTTTTTFSNG